MVQAFVLVVIIGIALIEAGLLYLNYQNKDKPLPKNVSDIFDETRYQKYLNYSAERYRLSFIRRGLNLLLMVSFLVFGLFAAFEQLSTSWFAHPIAQTLVFLAMFQLILFVIGIPFSYYSTFSIEERYGFNKTTKKTFVLDKLKSLGLMIVFGGGVVALLQAVYMAFENNLIMFAVISWAIIIIILTLISYLYTAIFVKIFNKIEPLEDGELKTRIESLAQEIGFKVKAISKMDASKRSTRLNAFFSGFGKQKEIVLFDTLIEKMSNDEILAVLAHEFAHGKHKDVIRMFAEQAIVLGIYAGLITLVFQTTSLYTAFGLSGSFFGFGLILFFLLIKPIDFIVGIPTAYLSRKAEYKADQFSAKILGNQPMIMALRVLAKEDLADLNPHPLFVKAYYSHPPMSLRIGALESLK